MSSCTSAGHPDSCVTYPEKVLAACTAQSLPSHAIWERLQIAGQLEYIPLQPQLGPWDYHLTGVNCETRARNSAPAFLEAVIKDLASFFLDDYSESPIDFLVRCPLFCLSQCMKNPIRQQWKYVKNA
jgi:hypothetical protein